MMYELGAWIAAAKVLVRRSGWIKGGGLALAFGLMAIGAREIQQSDVVGNGERK